MTTGGIVGVCIAGAIVLFIAFLLIRAALTVPKKRAIEQKTEIEFDENDLRNDALYNFQVANEINDLVETFMGDLVGEGVFDKYGEQFPLLIKIIDANDWLSV